MAENKKILIIGAPRSGTTYLSRVFKKIHGLDVRKERCGLNGGVGYNLAYHDVRARETTRNVPLKIEECFMVGHVIRDPRLCIPSITANLLDTKDWFGKANGNEHKHYDSTYGGIEWWWLYYNVVLCDGIIKYARRCGIPTLTFKIEDSDIMVPMMLGGFEIEDTESFKEIPMNYNHIKDYKKIEWENLPSPVVSYARRWYT